MSWFELDEKKLGGKLVIYRHYTIESSYKKLNDCFSFGYDVYDSELNPIIRFKTFDNAIKCIDKLMK